MAEEKTFRRKPKRKVCAFCADKIQEIDYKDIAKKGEKIVGLHIPSTGPLTPELVDESLERAYRFYKPNGGYLVLHCHSWMIYPPLYELFPKGSNLEKFYHRFDIFLFERISFRI